VNQRQADRKTSGLCCGCIIPVVVLVIAGVAMAGPPALFGQFRDSHSCAELEQAEA